MSERAQRFVVHHHRGHGPEHWDLMLEAGEVLATWRLDRHPAGLSDGPIVATRIGDHRTAYLTYEGPVSGGRGTVEIVDAGTYTARRQAAASLDLDFEGRFLSGRLTLRRDEPPGDRWTLNRGEDSDGVG